ncbi:AER123Wp [Eremothecium gossypii ATCC 10895]|uniref:Ornithine aminotransferase n=1 Tax=Eremothecium gossypii (strain ATCC 10895 / CBS 109.51 / FGSC 9923 / NRRL Y-1056) TaxID=284811 RepID=Q756Z1_EREGS|nr:AER123Wp [Eremothecium gossypii ATCC 10895]AAS52806.1 AER123Wp [Eremothecium gossypii ATCC 10895]
MAVEFNLSSKQTVEYEQEYSAHNYHPLPVVFHKASGAHVWDPEGKEYLDFLSAYSAVNQGHCHPEIVQALVDQASRLTLSSRAFSNDCFAAFAKYVTEYFGYGMVLPMNTGAEAVETALKLARRWGYMKKGIAADEAIILGASGNFHGRTFGAISLSTDEEDTRKHFGPFLKNTTAELPDGSGEQIRFGELADLERAFKHAGERIAAVILEPIQGEAGIVVPPEGYLEGVQRLCREHNALFICDEIQTGIGRTGKMLCYEHSEGVRPDIVVLGKAISGGILPVSCVLADKDIMLCFEPGSHGSTYGGNPLSSRVAVAALEVIRKENLVERARVLGEKLRAKLESLQAESNGIISEVRGKGLLSAIVIDPSKANGRTAWDLCLLMKDAGVLAKPTHEHIIRLAPPLVISEEDLMHGVDVIKSSLEKLPTVEKAAH